MTKRIPSKLTAAALALAAVTTLGLASNEGSGSVAAVAPVFRQSDVVGGRVTVDDLVYDHFGSPYRRDGVVYKGVTVGAPPWGAHEALPVGADPGWNWYEGTLFREETPWTGFVNIWGQLFPTAQSKDLGARLQVRNPQLWYLGADDVWRKVKPDQSPDSKIYGNFQYPETFTGTGWPDSVADIRSEGPGQGWSLRLGPLADVPGGPGSWHWFYNDDYGVKPPVPADMKALFVAAEMRLIHDVDRSIDLDADVNVIASIGSDNWPTSSGPAPRVSGGPELSGFVQPRMKFVTSEWNWFSGHTFAAWWDSNGTPLPSKMNDQLIRQFPPPLVGTSRDGGTRAPSGPQLATARRLGSAQLLRP
jgi:hypothetical protein